MFTVRFHEALVYAAELHASQRRKLSGAPYIAHLMAVTSIALEHGADEDTAIAALLHDAIEDQGGPPTREEIRRRFGERVVEIVDGCTDTDQTPKPPWRQRKESYIAHLGRSSADVQLVSAADKVHNARCLLAEYRAGGESIWKSFNGGKDGTLWYYRSLVETYRSGSAPPPLVEELARTVSELDRLTKTFL